MLAPITLTPEERKSLRFKARRAIGRVSERIHFVLLFAKGHRLIEIANIYEIDEQTVRTWIERYRQDGIVGLEDHPE
jgi:transposase